MSNQKRLRSNATALTTEQKQKLIEEAEITDDMDQKLAEEKMQKALDNKMKKELINGDVFDIGPVPKPNAERYIVDPTLLLRFVQLVPLFVLFKKYCVNPFACETVI